LAWIEAATLEAQLRVGAPAEDGERSLRGLLRVQNVTAGTLDAVGVYDSGLRAPIDLEAHASGQTDAFGAALELSSRAGQIAVALDVQALSRVMARVSTTRFAPAELLDTTAEPFAGGVIVRAEKLLNGERYPFSLDLEGARYAQIPLPAVHAEAVYDEASGLSLDQLVARSGQARLNAQGRLGKSGALELRAEISVPEISEAPTFASVLPDMQGALSAELELVRDGQRERAELEAKLDSARMSGASVGALSVHGVIHGFDLERSRGRVELEAQRIRAGATPIERLHARAQVAPGRIEVVGRHDAGHDAVAQGFAGVHDASG
jgi:hypothetical protein